MNSEKRVELPAAPQITVHRVLDTVGMLSPGPIPAISQALKQMRAGEVLLVHSDFPACETDLYVWSQQTNNQVLLVDRNAPRGFDFYILKGDPWPVSMTVDAKKAHCPTPILKASKILTEMESGDVLKLITTCPAAVSEVDCWVKAMRYQLLGITEDFRSVYRFYIRK